MFAQLYSDEFYIFLLVNVVPVLWLMVGLISWFGIPNTIMSDLIPQSNDIIKSFHQQLKALFMVRFRQYELAEWIANCNAWDKDLLKQWSWMQFCPIGL
jgi:hypothetical protein